MAEHQYLLLACTVQTSHNLNETREQNTKKTRVTRVQMQKSNFVCACVCCLNQWLNGYTVAGSLSVGAL